MYFHGSAPSIGNNVFYNSFDVIVYYLPGITGWGSTLSDRPTALWHLPYPVILAFPITFGVLTNGFGFTISWATNASLLIEACTDLANPTWAALQINVLTNGSLYFSDPDWTNYPGRFYRVRSP